MSFHFRWALLGVSLLLLTGRAALAEEHQTKRMPMLPEYQQECAACHVAYPPRMLPQASWQRLMNNLPHHFGVDASLDPASVQALSTWLTQHAATDTRHSKAPPDDRITRSPWFIREHNELPPTIWKLPAVKSPSNCIACHTQANQGDFNEHFIRLPR